MLNASVFSNSHKKIQSLNVAARFCNDFSGHKSDDVIVP